MKKTLSVIVLSLLALGASAQDKGRFEVYDLGDFKLHVYYTNDALGDASYLIEGGDALVTMEQPLFKDNVATPISRNWARRSRNASRTIM